MALPTASDNVFTRFLISEGGSTSTPAAGRVTMYAKADGLMYSKDDAGTEKLMSTGGLGLSATYLGYNTVGASFKNMNGVYLKKVTVASAGAILSISAHVKGNGSNLGSLGAVVFSDTAGVPLNQIAHGGASTYDATDAVMTGATHMNTTARWIDLPIFCAVTATDYWIGVVGGNNGGGTQLAYDTSGADHVGASFYPADRSVTTTADSTHRHSIRAVHLAITIT